MALVDEFVRGGGFDPEAPADLEDYEPGEEFLAAFQAANITGISTLGSGSVMNSNITLLPTRSDPYRDSSVFNDFRLGNGLGVSRPYRRPDSQPGSAPGGMYGRTGATKMFGRDAVTPDLNFRRDDLMERARMGLKKLGFKDGEVPQGAGFKEYVWNNPQDYGTGTHTHQYNRNYLLPDADAVARRLYEPTPSRKTKMLGTDTEVASLLPQRTLVHPMKYVTEDMQRSKMQRVPRNVDVAEAVVYENIMPRGMGGAIKGTYVWGRTDGHRVPVGSNDTGDRSVFGRWNNPHDLTGGGAMHATSMQDRLQMQNDAQKYIRGHDIDAELDGFHFAESQMDMQAVEDPFMVYPQEGEFPRAQSGPNRPLIPPAGVRTYMG